MSASVARQTALSSSSDKTLSRDVSAAGARIPAQGDTSIKPRSIAHAHMRRNHASVRFPVTGLPRVTMPSRRLWMSARVICDRRRPRHGATTSRPRSRSISAAVAGLSFRLACCATKRDVTVSIRSRPVGTSAAALAAFFSVQGSAPQETFRRASRASSRAVFKSMAGQGPIVHLRGRPLKRYR